MVYDEFSDVSSIDYPSGIKLGGITRDQLGRENSNTYTLASGQQIVETVERHISGDIKQGSENGVNKSYSYDNAGRLIAAQIGDNNFAYEFGQPDAACQNISGYNPHTAKNGNRTKLTMKEAKENYKKYGAVREELADYVRKPYEEERDESKSGIARLKRSIVDEISKFDNRNAEIIADKILNGSGDRSVPRIRQILTESDISDLKIYRLARKIVRLINLLED